ncbi:radical SAM protein [Magnetococcales bacterium HHB-1]
MDFVVKDIKTLLKEKIDPEIRAELGAQLCGNHLVFNSQQGAHGLFDDLELIVLTLWKHDKNHAVQDYFLKLGLNQAQAEQSAKRLVAKLYHGGWFTEEISQIPPDEPWRGVYFTITRRCNAACPYCYQGEQEKKTDISLEHADLFLHKMKQFNPDCLVLITGGEPLMHPGFFKILDMIQNYQLPFALLTNGILLDQNVIKRLAEAKRLHTVQVSLDGFSEKVHNLTRRHHAKTMAAIRMLGKYKLPFIVAPTIHQDNHHELPQIADFAQQHGGQMKANSCATLAHAPSSHIQIDEETLFRALYDLSAAVDLKQIQAQIECNKTPLLRPICGVAHAVFNVDWNGDIFPCHMLRQDELLLGNLQHDNIPSILQRVKERKICVPAHEIKACRSCEWVLTCAGGCRAIAYQTYGDLGREDPKCDLLYRINLTKAIRSTHVLMQTCPHATETV